MTIYTKASIFVIFFLATLLLDQVSSQIDKPPNQPNPFLKYCGVEVGNYTANSTYETNLKNVLSDLQTHASTEFFYNATSAGNGTNTVYGQYYCRRDIDSTLCSQCIEAAAVEVFRNCSAVKVAVWFQECTLRYNNESMVGIYQPTGNYSYGRDLRHNVTSDPVTFNGVLSHTVITLLEKAASGPNKFATGEGVVSAVETVYTLMQCSPDLDVTQCDTCLRSAYGRVQTCCGHWPAVVFVFYQSCEVMYSTLGAFYFTSDAPPSPPSLTFVPPPSDLTTSQPPPVNPPPPPKVGLPFGSSDGGRIETVTTMAVLMILMLVLHI